MYDEQKQLGHKEEEVLNIEEKLERDNFVQALSCVFADKALSLTGCSWPIIAAVSTHMGYNAEEMWM